MQQYSDLKGKTVIIKATTPPVPIIGKIADVEEKGVWVKADILGLESGQPFSAQWAGVKDAAAKMEDAIAFIPLCQIHWLLTPEF